MISRILFRIYLEYCHLIHKSSLLTLPCTMFQMFGYQWLLLCFSWSTNLKYQSLQNSVSVSAHPPTPFPPKGRAANARMGGGGGSIQISTRGIRPGSNGDPRMQMWKPPIGNSKISWNRCSVSVKLIHLSLSILRYLISISYSKVTLTSIHSSYFSGTLALIYNPYACMKMFAVF